MSAICASSHGDCCIAHSIDHLSSPSPLQVLQCYKDDGFNFLLRAFNTPNYLEDLTGLSKLYAQTDDIDDQVQCTQDQYYMTTIIISYAHTLEQAGNHDNNYALSQTQVWELSEDENED